MRHPTYQVDLKFAVCFSPSERLILHLLIDGRKLFSPDATDALGTTRKSTIDPNLVLLFPTGHLRPRRDVGRPWPIVYRNTSCGGMVSNHTPYDQETQSDRISKALTSAGVIFTLDPNRVQTVWPTPVSP
jgi:hypothetical protein